MEECNRKEDTQEVQMMLRRKCLLKLSAVYCGLANYMNENHWAFHCADVCSERIFVLFILHTELAEQIYLLLFLLKMI